MQKGDRSGISFEVSLPEQWRYCSPCYWNSPCKASQTWTQQYLQLPPHPWMMSGMWYPETKAIISKAAKPCGAQILDTALKNETSFPPWLIHNSHVRCQNKHDSFCLKAPTQPAPAAHQKAIAKKPVQAGTNCPHVLNLSLARVTYFILISVFMVNLKGMWRKLLWLVFCSGI